MAKGISAVISVILLLLITVAITGFAYVFFFRTAETVTGETENSVDQTTSQIGTKFLIEGVNRNQVYVRNIGITPITSLAFYADNNAVGYAGPSSLAPGSVGTYYLNDSQLSMLPDPATLKVTGGLISEELFTGFYGYYLAGHWNFDEGAGTTAADSSGKGNTGNLTNVAAVCSNPPTAGCPLWTSGKFGGAIQFDGINDFVNMSDVLDMTGTQPYTLQAWVKTPSSFSTGPRIIVGKDGGPRNGYLLYMDQTTPQFKTERWAGTGVGINGNLGVLANTWYFVTATYDGSALRLYVNGKQEGSAVVQALSIPDTNYYLLVGAWTNNPTDFFSGTIDEVKILNVARSMTTS